MDDSKDAPGALVAIEVGDHSCAVLLDVKDVPEFVPDLKVLPIAADYKHTVIGLFEGFVRVRVYGLWRAGPDRLIADKVKALSGTLLPFTPVLEDLRRRMLEED